MPFVANTFVDGPAGGTPITAAALNNLGQGVAAADITNPSSAAGIQAAGYFTQTTGDARYAAIGQGKQSAIFYVTAAGNNTLDGLSWATAKATVGGALTALAGAAGTVNIASGTITESVAWGYVAANTIIRGQGRLPTILLHGFNGDLATLGGGVTVENLTIAGQGATFTGRCFVFTTTDGNQSISNVTLSSFGGVCLDFAIGAGSGFRAVNVEAWQYGGLTTTGLYAVRVTDAVQLAAVPRTFVNFTTAGQCGFSFGGSNDLFISGSFVADLLYSPNTRGVQIVATRIANQANMTVDGHNNTLVACDINPIITIASGADAISVGPGSYNNLPIVDNSGNSRNAITHWAIAYTPTLTSGGTAPVLGNGTVTGMYSRQGATITIDVQLTVGSTTTLGTGGLRLSLPQARSNASIATFGTAVLLAGTTNYTAVVRIPGNVNYCEMIRDTSGAVTASSPAAFASGDTFRFSGTYLI